MPQNLSQIGEWGIFTFPPPCREAFAAIIIARLSSFQIHSAASTYTLHHFSFDINCCHSVESRSNQAAKDIPKFVKHFMWMAQCPPKVFRLLKGTLVC